MIIGIADLGIGNFAAMAKMFDRLGAQPRRLDSPSDIASVDRLVLPGVGAFDYAARVLDELKWREPLLQFTHEANKPLLAVCVGMQLLTQTSEEGLGAGLGWIPGRCIRFVTHHGDGLKVPHMGWNDLAAVREDLLLTNDETQRFYFVHSYYLDCPESYVVASCDYGITFPAAVRKEMVWGVQFHPEKSHRFGLELLRRFVELPC